MPFEKFTGSSPGPRGHALPQNMVVGQVVTRKNAKRGQISGLRSLMRKAMRESGASFSVDHGPDYYAIRRDS